MTICSKCGSVVKLAVVKKLTSKGSSIHYEARCTNESCGHVERVETPKKKEA